MQCDLPQQKSESLSPAGSITCCYVSTQIHLSISICESWCVTLRPTSQDKQKSGKVINQYSLEQVRQTAFMLDMHSPQERLGRGLQSMQQAASPQLQTALQDHIAQPASVATPARQTVCLYITILRSHMCNHIAISGNLLLMQSIKDARTQQTCQPETPETQMCVIT